MEKEKFTTRLPTPEDRKREQMELLLATLGLDGTDEEAAEVEAHIAKLRAEIEKSPMVGRMMESGVRHRREFVIPLTSREQQEQLVSTLAELGIFPWEEQGLLIVDRKSDLHKLKLAGIVKGVEYREEKPVKEESAVGPDIDAQRYAFPLPAQAPVERRKEARKPKQERKMAELLELEEDESGVDMELLDIIRRFDEGLLDDDEPEFTRAFGNMPTLTLFPHKYIWDRKTHTHTHARTGEVFGDEEELQLLRKAREGDSRATEEFVRMHVGAVLFLAKRVHEKFGGDIDEIFQNGLLGLEYAMREYEEEKVEESHFTAYAFPCIEGYMRSGLKKQSTVHVPSSNKRSEVRRLRNKEQKLKQLVGPAYGTDEDRDRLLGIERLERRLLIGAQFDPIESHFDDEAWQKRDVRGNSLAQLPEQIEQVDAETLRQRINKVLLTLTPREEMVIRLRFGLGEYNQSGLFEATKAYSSEEGLSLEAVAEIMGVTRERPRQIEARALRKMKYPGRSIHISGFVKARGKAAEDQSFRVRRAEVEKEKVEVKEQPKPEPIVFTRFGFRKPWTSLDSLAEEFTLSSQSFSRVTPEKIRREAEVYRPSNPEWFNEKGELHEDLVKILSRKVFKEHLSEQESSEDSGIDEE